MPSSWLGRLATHKRLSVAASWERAVTASWDRQAVPTPDIAGQQPEAVLVVQVTRACLMLVRHCWLRPLLPLRCCRSKLFRARLADWMRVLLLLRVRLADWMRLLPLPRGFKPSFFRLRLAEKKMDGGAGAGAGVAAPVSMPQV